jgi:hypothetical protein
LPTAGTAGMTSGSGRGAAAPMGLREIIGIQVAFAASAAKIASRQLQSYAKPCFRKIVNNGFSILLDRIPDRYPSAMPLDHFSPSQN